MALSRDEVSKIRLLVDRIVRAAIEKHDAEVAHDEAQNNLQGYLLRLREEK